MNIQIHAHSKVLVQHRRPYDYDEKSGLWRYRTEGEDEWVGNIVTNAGRVTLHTFIYGKAADRVGLGAGMHFIGVSGDATTPSALDTFLTGELSADGLGRAEGTVTLPTGAGTITTVANTFTYTGGTSQSVQKTALFDALSGGNMAHEILFTQRTLFSGDILELTFAVTIT